MSWLQFDLQDRRVLFWRLQTAGWGVMVLMTGVVAQAGDFANWSAITVGLSRAAFGFTVTTWLLRPLLARARRRRMNPYTSAVLFLAGCAGLAWLDTAMAKRLAVVMDVTGRFEQQYMNASIVLRWLLYSIWCGLYYVIHYWLDSQEAQLRLARLEAEMRTAELQRLRAQVNPHFLFNAFNSILAETENPRSVAALTQGVAEYLRFSLRQPEAGQLLGEELDALHHYLQVEKIRFEERLEFAFRSDERARQCRVPGALVQPLVENSIKYGQRTSPAPLRIEIDVSVEGESLLVRVNNTGAWVEPDAARGGGIGLANLRQRLDLLFGEQAGLTVAAESGWVRASLRLPAELDA